MIDAFFTAMDASMNDVLGSETASLRRTLRLSRPDGSPATALLVVAMAPSGATSVRLRAAEGPLEGYVGKGLTLTIGAHAYAVAEDAPRDVDGTVLVSVAPPLAMGVAINASASLPQYMDWDLPHSLAYKPLETVLQGDLTGAVSFALSVPRSTTAQEPRLDDILTCSMGTGAVFAFLPSDGGSWEPLVGRAGVPAADLPRRQVPARNW